MKTQKFALLGVPLVLLAVGLSAPAWAQTPSPPNAAIRDFVQSILSDHPALREAQAALDSAEAQAKGQARPLYNPELQFGYDDAASETKEIGISQTIDIGGKRGARTDVANAQVATAEARLVIARKALLTNLLTAFASYQAAADASDVAERRVGLDQEFLNLADRRSRAGDLPQTELLTARLTLAEAKASASTAAVEFSRAEEQLLAIVGSSSAPLPRLTGTPGSASPMPPASIIDQLPELRLAAMQAQTARSRIRVAQKNRIPDPTVGLNFGQERETSPLRNTTSSTVFGVRLSIPFPVRNSYGAEVTAAGSDLIAAEQSLRNQRRAMEARLNASLRRYETARNAWQTWTEQGAGSLDEQRDLLQRLWEAGEVNAVDYIIQLNQTFATERAGIDLWRGLWTAWFEWLGASASISEWMETPQ